MAQAQGIEISVFWFRRDLRLEDNRGLNAALESGRPVLPVFIFDSEILKRLSSEDARVGFIHQQLEALNARLRDVGSALHVFHGNPLHVWQNLFAKFRIQAVFCNEDYEPYARTRDAQILKLCESNKISFQAFKDQVIFAKGEVSKDDATPYRVFTPYSRKWKAQLSDSSYASYPSEKKLNLFFQSSSLAIPMLQKLGFAPSDQRVPARKVSLQTIKNYEAQRNFLARTGASHLGPHLRFGTGSVRKLVRVALQHSQVFLNELIWREFFMQVLFHFPNTVDQPFDSRFGAIEWRNNRSEFERWCAGQTGVPIVDAGMRELNATGFMHNRARMITASFLTKHLLIDWRWGERYFASQLLDFELASNVGNWQWVAGCGCDAAPYFRIFNPYIQAKKFDPDGEYVATWVAEHNTSKYPKPIVDHEFARRRAIVVFDRALKPQGAKL